MTPTETELRMRDVVVVNNITLDGVMQSPAAKDEDPRGGFEHGGWAAPYNDEVKGREMGKGMARAARDLIDRYVLLIHPIILGTGQRLFDEQGALATFDLDSSVPTTKGVIIATYQRTRT